MFHAENEGEIPKDFSEVFKIVDYGSNGCYSGIWRDNIKHGFGSYRFSDGSECFSFWKNGQMEGPGTTLFSNGDIYAGWFADNLKNGVGIYASISGKTYDGFWKNDKKNGKGKSYINNECVFEGDLLNGECEGLITCKNINSTIDVNCVIGGQPFGDGVRWSSNLEYAYRLKDGKKGRRITATEAKRTSAEIGLPIPSIEFQHGTPKTTKFLHLKEDVETLMKIECASLSQLSKRIEALLSIFHRLQIGIESLSVEDLSKKIELLDKKCAIMPLKKKSSFEKNEWKREHHDPHEYNVIEFDDGIYNGKINITTGQRSQDGIMMYKDGSLYDGYWRNGLKHGNGKFCNINGEMESCCYFNNKKSGIGVKWNSDQSRAWQLFDGKQLEEISLDRAISMCIENNLKPIQQSD